jgi:hypothetical protein
MGGRAFHRLALPCRVRPLQLCLGGIAQVEGDLTENLEAFPGSHWHPGPLDLDRPLRDLGQPLQPGDLLLQLPLPGLQMVQGVGLRVLEDDGDLLEGEAQFTVEEDLLQTHQVGVAVEPVAGRTAVAGREQPRLVVVVQRPHRHPGKGRDLPHGITHPPAPFIGLKSQA